MTDATLTGCPDGGHCHHQCATTCYRVGSSGPLSGVYPGDRWPDEVLQAHGHPERMLGTSPVALDPRAVAAAALRDAAAQLERVNAAAPGVDSAGIEYAVDYLRGLADFKERAVTEDVATPDGD